MERDDRAIYGFLSQLVSDVKSGVKKDPTDTEMKLLTLLMSNYIEVRLTNKFLIDVTKPLMKFLDIFEKDEIKIHVRYEKIVELIYGYSSKYLKNAGLDFKEGEVEKVTGKDLLKIKYDDSKLQLSDKDFFLGPLVEEFLVELKVARDSPLIASWLLNVREFYVEVMFKLNKYFSTSLKSRTLQYMSVLAPSSVLNKSTDILRKQ